MSIGLQTRPDYIRFELAVVPDGDRWRAFATRVDKHMTPWPVGLGEYFDLPTMPSRELALELGCLLIWARLDEARVQVGYDQEQGTEIWHYIDELE